MQLSGWQTVAISLSGGAVTGTAALAGAWLRGRQDRTQLDRRLEHERELQTRQLEHRRDEQLRQLEHDRAEQWRDSFVRAADDFATGVDQAILGVRDVIAAVADRGDVDAAAAEAKRRSHEAVARMARIRLLFGADSPTVAPAMDLLSEIEIARAAAGKPDATFAWQKLEKVYALRSEFEHAALEMIKSPRWRVSASLAMPFDVATADEHPVPT